MKDKILKMLKAKEEARDALVAQSEKSENVEELRSINKQLETMKQEIRELQAMAEEAEGKERQKTPEELEAEARTKAVQEEAAKRAKAKAEGRQYIPGKGFQATPEGTQQENGAVAREKEMKERGEALREGRSISVSSSNIVVPQYFGNTINQTFQQVSSLVDAVDIMPFEGGESFTQGYIKSNTAAGYSAETDNYSDADIEYGYAAMAKARMTAYSEITNQVQKLSPAVYADNTLQGVRTSVRMLMGRQIMVGDGATNHLAGIFSAAATAIDADTDISIAEIDNETLDKIIFGYGGNEAVEGQAVLILNKTDLAAFARLRSADGKKFHAIIPNAVGTGGTIDGYPYIINSACGAVSLAGTASGAYCMAYGNLKNYKLAVFSDLDVERSTDYKFKEGMIAHRGEIYLAGNVVAQNGFLRVKKS